MNLHGNNLLSPPGIRPPSDNVQIPVVTPSAEERSGSPDSSSFGTANSGSATPPSLPKFVKLNVGGTKYETSRATLCSVPGSHLEAMFSGRHSLEELQTEDGSYFIDRDGRHFRHILNFLRTGCIITLPTDSQAKEELAIEADFYGLEALVKAIRMPKMDVLECLPAETLSQWEAEQKLRSDFADGEAKKFCKTDPFRGLIPLFPVTGQKEEVVHTMPLKYDPKSPILLKGKHTLFMNNLRTTGENKKSKASTPVTVKTMEEFQTNFNKGWPNVLHRLHDVLLEEPIIVAGGAVLRSLTASDGIRTADWWETEKELSEKSDIDVFLYGCDREEANRIARRIFYALAWDNECWAIIRSRGVCNICDQASKVKVQIVLRIYDSPTEVLIGFDLDTCCCAYDGRNVWVCPRWKSAIQSGVNVLNPLHAWPKKASYEFRLAKYAFRGFGVAVPGVDKSRIDYDLIHQSDIANLEGLARFLKVSSELETAPPRNRRVYDRVARRWNTVERLRTPREVITLRKEEKNVVSEDLRLIEILDTPYDDHEWALQNLVVPEVYSINGPEWAFVDLDFPVASECRDQGWAEIEDAGDLHPEFVPQRLIDAWDTSKRSREYLNGQMDKYDLDNLYYSKAYRNNDKSGH